jgi:hypothetical protein
MDESKNTLPDGFELPSEWGQGAEDELASLEKAIDFGSLRAEIAALRAELEKVKEERDAARTLLERLMIAERWLEEGE